ncbi:hypothetical protein AQPE_3206 [Aquipluma nitroreducens]|uniref:DUF2293 domain-containing protein n=1 Tax=Aquipluma nitroreducens TaxID=2010828 RepID=A0A5K7SBT3_9BACT|nr:DUF2293 domain-containing protein [Aquipluma nitroreducens]BBE19033.1 hypothetical protein AQPE_3206 [Aquipluma nitroreducens]
MNPNILIVKPGARTELTGPNGETLKLPTDWAFLPAGDAGITRKVTSKGLYWRVEIKKGRRTISLGIWAPETTILEAQQEVQQSRLTDEYKKKQTYAVERREKKQTEYEADFCSSVECFLNFHKSHKELEKLLAKAVTTHAIPVGSGTVARTQLIPIEERAAHAVIAWMRHQTTAYDNLKIARVKGERRAVRQSLAQQSVELLASYREGRPASENCPLQKALNKLQ